MWTISFKTLIENKSENRGNGIHTVKITLWSVRFSGVVVSVREVLWGAYSNSAEVPLSY